MAPEAPTRQRLLEAGMRLFAERGFKGTTVGDIEAVAGLQPRRGALYKHFASKEELLRAGVERHLDAVSIGAAQLGELDLSAIDPEVARGLIVETGRWFLDELDRQRELTHLLEQEGDRLPEVRAAVHEQIVDAGHRAAAGLAGAVAGGAVDVEALAVVLMGSLVALRRTAWTFGGPPLAVDDDRALSCWADVVVATLARLALN